MIYQNPNKYIDKTVYYISCLFYILTLFARFIKINVRKSVCYSIWVVVFGLICLFSPALAENNSLEITTTHNESQQNLFQDSLTGQVFDGKLPKDICHQSISEAEKQANIPKDLLTAIALTEAGRWQGSNQSSIIWPWSLTVLGKGHFYETPELAVSAAETFFAHGISNLDIGCMQINVQYHRQAFSSLAEMFDPIYNAAYAANFLISLKDDLGTWSNAVAAYHSRTPNIGENYGKKVMSKWNSIKKEKRENYQQELAKSLEESKQKQISENAKKAQIRAENEAIIEKRKKELKNTDQDIWKTKKSYKKQQREEITARARVLNSNQPPPKINDNITYHSIKENQNFNTSEQWLLEKLEELDQKKQNKEVKLP